MNINKDTICCISIAEKPGNFGAILFNIIFKALDLNYIYKPFRVSALDLEAAVKGIRAFGIRGCGVSMPHKTEVIKYLDQIDAIAKKIGAVNTIVNDQGVLTGFNTDFVGAKRAINEAYDVQGKDALVIGAGGVARAIVLALKENGARDIFITNRDEQKAKDLSQGFSCHSIPFDRRNEYKAHLLVNATSVGMSPNFEDIVIDEQALDSYEACLDVVVSPRKTRLIQAAESRGIIFVPGFKMALYQGIAQCKLYTSISVPENIVEDAIKSYFLNTL